MPLKTVANLLQRGNNNLDLIRIGAALTVIWSHAYAINNIAKLTEPVSSFTGKETGGSIAVYIFFFISGMLVTNSLLTKKNIVDFILARIFRVIPALAFLLIITALIIGPFVTSLTISEYFSSPQWHRYITKNLLMDTQFSLPGVFEHNSYPGSVNGSLWTIRYEVICYLILPLLLLMRVTNNKIISTSLCLFVIFAPTIEIIKNHIPLYNFFYIVVVFSCFALGGIYAIHKHLIRVSLLIPMFFLLLHLITERHYPSISKLFLPFFFCTIALWFSSLNLVKNLHIKYDISYGVYLWGFLIQQLISKFLNMNIYLSQILAILLAIVAGYLSSKFLEIPALKLYKKIMKHSWIMRLTPQK